ncbi:MAG TPA: caspase family protein [Pirellulales bacterium]|nr:caspase family protein [Pirellulales bacterium]
MSCRDLLRGDGDTTLRVLSDPTAFLDRFLPAVLAAIVVWLSMNGPSAFSADAIHSASPANGAPAAAPGTIHGERFHALLVGCTKYDNFDQAKWLNGPANDVDLVRRFLTDPRRLAVPAASIVVLSELEAAAKGADFRPTRANIEREIQKLIDSAQSGDQVLLLMAGHGSQQPEHGNPDPTYIKPDGYDQMFLPCDCGRWNGKTRFVDRAIADYELRTWCKQITYKKARLWVVLDACCSGWVLRGGGAGDNKIMRRNVSSEDLGIPKAELDKARDIARARRTVNQAGSGTRSADSDAPAFDFGPQSPDYVGLYAAQRDESELEMPMPCDPVQHQPQRVQGLLTYAVIDILSRTAHPITYGELASLVRQRYPQWGLTAPPTPVVEGLAQDREVLGVERWPDRSRRQWAKSGSHELSVNEGSVEGLTPGSIVALYPSADQADAKTVLGYATVRSCDLLESDAEPSAYEGTPIPRMGSLPAGGVFEIVRTDHGSLRVRLAVDTVPMHTGGRAAETAGSAAARAGIVAGVAGHASLKALASQLKTAFAAEGSLCEFVDNPAAAQWILQMRDGKLNLLSKDTAQIRDDLPPEAPQFGVSEDNAVADIVDDMTTIARAQNLLNLTQMEQTAADVDARSGSAADSSQPNVKLELLRYKSKSDRNGRPIDFSKGPLVLVPGDYVGWRMTNLGRSDVAVSLLYINAGFGIVAIYPRPGSGTDNLLTKNGGHFSTRPARVTAKPVGNEHVVLIAMPRQAGRQSPDFSFLEQRTLPPRSRGDDNPALTSPLGQLLQKAMYGEGGLRGLEADDSAQAHLMLQSWRVSAETGR